MASTTQITTNAPNRVVQLSSFSQRHFDSVCLQQDALIRSILAEKEDDNVEITLPEFTLFERLPQELQDHILKLYITDNPQIVLIKPDKRHTPTFHTFSPLLNINHKIRAYASIGYGYFQQNVIDGVRPGPETSSAGTTHTYTFHPEVDMLYIHYSVMRKANMSKLKFLDSEPMFSRLRCLAIDTYSTSSSLSYFWRIFAQCKNLELVFIVDTCATTVSPTSLDIKFRERGVDKKFALMMLPQTTSEILSDLFNGPCFTHSKQLVRGWQRVHGLQKAVPQIVIVANTIAKKLI